MYCTLVSMHLYVVLSYGLYVHTYMTRVRRVCYMYSNDMIGNNYCISDVRILFVFLSENLITHSSQSFSMK